MSFQEHDLPKSLSISLCLFSLVKCELGGYFDSREMFCSILVSSVVSTARLLRIIQCKSPLSANLILNFTPGLANSGKCPSAC